MSGKNFKSERFERFSDQHWRWLLDKRYSLVDLQRARKLAVARAQGAEIEWKDFAEIFEKSGIKLIDAARILGTTDVSLRRWRKKGWVESRHAQRLALAVIAIERETLQGCIERIDLVLKAFAIFTK